MKTPQLTLVGAGRGILKLITVKGVKALAAADVVLYDALVNPELLQYAPDAEHIPVGKRAGQASVSQSTINHLIVEHALANKHVVRLKGGDPFLFARGFEELEYARKYGIQTASVVGVSSLHLPGVYGIPLTVRGVNQSICVVTATTANGTLSPDVDHAAAQSPMTLFFMGLGKLDLIVDKYLQAGRGDLPVAIISRGSMDDAFVYQSTVKEVLTETAEIDIPAPALLLFGEGAGISYEAVLPGLQKEITEVA